MPRHREEIWERGLSHKWQLVLAFFLGGAVSSLAQDPSDTIFFWASSKGTLTAAQQSIYWYWVPFLIYLGIFGLGYGLARSGWVSPSFLLYFYIALVLISLLFSMELPQASDNIYVGSALIGTVVSVGIILGLRHKVERL